MSTNLVAHAKRELAVIGESAEDTAAYLKICEIFASMGHCGGSASVAISIINSLLNEENLSPLTNNPLEWELVSEGTWQNNRFGGAFSNDAGKTFWLLTDKTMDGRVAHIHVARQYDSIREMRESVRP